MIHNSPQQRWTALIVGLLLNALGQGFCIVGAMGSGIWTASAINLGDWQGWSVGSILFVTGILNALTNQFLLRRLDWPRFISQVIYAMFYGYLVNFFTWLLALFGIGSWNVFARAFVSCFGVFIFGIAISLYQRANIVMHPNDDTTNILRFRYLKGNATLAQFIDFLPPIVLTIITFIATHKLLGINVATAFSMLFNGVIIAWADRHIWPTLKHNFKIVDPKTQS